MKKVWTASEMGKKGGRSRSPKKLAAIRENSKKGGRARKADHEILPESLKQREYRARKKMKAKKAVPVLMLVFCLFAQTCWAGLDSDKALYIGGSVAEFKHSKDPVEGMLCTADDQKLIFQYGAKHSESFFTIPYAKFVDIEYGQKAGRRVGAAVATAVLLSPVGLALLFSKKRKHFVTIGFKDDQNQDQVAVFELGKDTVRTTLAIIETRSGKRIEYQDEEARKNASRN